MENSLPPQGGDTNLGPGYLALAYTFLGLSLFFVGMRMFARMPTQIGLGWDDYTMLLAVMISCVEVGLINVSVNSGGGRHFYYLETSQTIETAKWAYWSQLVNRIGLFFAKVSVSLFLLRLVVFRDWVKVLLYANIAILSISLVACSTVYLVQCNPISKNWNLLILGSCLPKSWIVAVIRTNAALSTVTDFLSALLPFPILWNSQMPRRTKVSVLALLGLGIFAAACGLVTLIKVRILEDMEDFTWNMVSMGRWGIAEFHLGMIVGSIPPSRSYYIYLASKICGKSFRRTNAMPNMAPRMSWGKRVDYYNRQGSSDPGWSRARRATSVDRGSGGSHLPLCETPDSLQEGKMVQMMEMHLDQDR